MEGKKGMEGKGERERRERERRGGKGKEGLASVPKNSGYGPADWCKTVFSTNHLPGTS